MPCVISANGDHADGSSSKQILLLPRAAVARRPGTARHCRAALEHSLGGSLFEYGLSVAVLQLPATLSLLESKTALWHQQNPAAVGSFDHIIAHCCC